MNVGASLNEKNVAPSIASSAHGIESLVVVFREKHVWPSLGHDQVWPSLGMDSIYVLLIETRIVIP